MWNCSLKYLTTAFSYFPKKVDTITHTILFCEQCGNIHFPSSKGRLTTKTPAGAITGHNGRQLKISNYQRRMNHVHSCPRVGMPLSSAVVKLSKSEMQFLLSRINESPQVPAYHIGPQYVPRKKILCKDDNQLHQVYLHVLRGLMGASQQNPINVTAPLKQIADMMTLCPPTSIFSEWSPARETPEFCAQPCSVQSSEDHSERHSSARVLEPGSTYWRSAITETPSKTDSVFFILDFDNEIQLSSIVIKWNKKYPAFFYSLHFSSDGIAYKEVARIEEDTKIKRFVFAEGCRASHVKIEMYTSKSKDNNSFGIESIKVYKREKNSLYLHTSDTLNDLQTWIATSCSGETFEVALAALQGLVLSSGSLVATLRLISVLLQSSVSSKPLSEATKAFSMTTLQKLIDWVIENAFGTSKSTSPSPANLSDEPEPRTPRRRAPSPSTPEHSSMDRVRIFRNLPHTLIHSSAGFNGVLPSLDSLPMSNHTANSAYLSRGSTSANPFSMMSYASPMDAPQLVQEIAQMQERLEAVETLMEEKPKAQVEKQPHQKGQDDASFLPFVSFLRRLVEPKLLELVNTPMQLSMILLTCLSELSVWQMHRMQKSDCVVENSDLDQNTFPLEEPFSIQVCVEVFQLCQELLSLLLSHRLETKDGLDRGAFYQELGQACTSLNNGLPETSEFKFLPQNMGLAVLQIITANLRRLVLSKVNPADVGISPAPAAQDCDLAAPPELSTMLATLENLITAGCKTEDELFPLSLQAAAAVEVGMEALYPSSMQRTQLLTSRMGYGATLELQFRWPAAEDDQEDPRFERLTLLLQLACTRLNVVHAVRGSWDLYMHLIVMVPQEMKTEDMLRKTFDECIQNAGFVSWQVIAGAQEISVTLQRHLHWNRIEKMSHDSGSGWIRVYPRNVASYNDVLREVDAFVEIQRSDSQSL